MLNKSVAMRNLINLQGVNLVNPSHKRFPWRFFVFCLLVFLLAWAVSAMGETFSWTASAGADGYIIYYSEYAIDYQGE